MCLGLYYIESHGGFCDCGCDACKQLSKSRDEHNLKCLGRQQWNRSDKITELHIAGVFCKKSNQCRICSKIKFYSRLLRHIGGVCGKSKKCEACQWKREFPTQSFKYSLNTGDIWKRLYNLMFYPHGKKCRYQ